MPAEDNDQAPATATADDHHLFSDGMYTVSARDEHHAAQVLATEIGGDEGEFGGPLVRVPDDDSKTIWIEFNEPPFRRRVTKTAREWAAETPGRLVSSTEE